MNSILVTGGTGYFARNFIAEILKNNITERICVYSRNEFNQHLLKIHFNDDPRLRYFIGDVRDKDRLSMALRGIDIVVHAAALKRTEVCAYNIFEAVNTNVVGTENVIKASVEQGVSKVVFLSSDKACNPTTTYGFTKALGEKLLLHANSYSNDTLFAAVRYGNVANSTGSVIPLWRKHLESHDFVNITDPRCTRFWMTAQQAVALVMATIEMMKGGELNIPDLPAFCIEDLAKAMGAIHTRVIGLPIGEKLHEQMKEGETSETARRMSVQELRDCLLQLT